MIEKGIVLKLVDKYKNLPIMVKASFWFFFASFLQNGISVLTTPIFTRLLSTSEYGEYSVFNSWMDIFSVFISLKMYAGVFSSSIIKFEDNRQRYTAAVQGLSLTLTIIWTIFYTFNRKTINTILSLSSAEIYAMIVMIWTTSVFSFWSVEQRVDNKYINLVIVTILISILKPAVGIILVLNSNNKVTARIIGLAVVQFIVYITFFIKDIYRGKVFFDKNYWCYMLKFCIPLIPHYISSTIMNSSDRIMIKNMIGNSEAGIYGLAYSICMVMLIFNNALIQTLEPWIVKKIKNNEHDDIGKVVYIALAIVALADIVFILIAPEAVRIFSPDSYYDGRWVVPPVTMSVYFQFLYSTFALFQFYYEKKILISIASFIGAALNIVLNYIFIPLFGYYAAGYTTLICIAFYAGAHYLLMNRVCKKEYGRNVFNNRYILFFTLVFVTIGFLLIMTYYNDYIRYAIIAILIIMICIFRRRIFTFLRILTEVRKK